MLKCNGIDENGEVIWTVSFTESEHQKLMKACEKVGQTPEEFIEAAVIKKLDKWRVAGLLPERKG